MLTSTTQYDPFGNIVGGSSPDNQAGTATNAWVGNNQKLAEEDMSLNPVQMGARVYLAKVGRFLQVDPVEGGTDNNYAYANDPVNDFDLDGNFGMQRIFRKSLHMHTSVLYDVHNLGEREGRPCV